MSAKNIARGSGTEKRKALQSRIPKIKYSTKWPTGETSTACPKSASAASASKALMLEIMPNPSFMVLPVLADIQKIRTPIQITAIQLMHCLRWARSDVCLSFLFTLQTLPLKSLCWYSKILNARMRRLVRLAYC